MKRVVLPMVLALAVVSVALIGLVLSGRGPERAVVAPQVQAAPAVTFAPRVGPAESPGPRAESESVTAQPVIVDLVVEPSDDVLALIRSMPSGATIKFGAGTYRELEIEPKDDQTFVGEPGAVLNGSRVLTGFEREGGVWTVDGQDHGSPQAVQDEEWGFCDDDRPSCVFPEDLFVDGVPLRRADQARDVGPGTWFFDYDRDSVTIGDDPTGRLVEVSAARWAFHGSADRVEIRGFEIAQYATPGRQGAINPRVGRIGPAGRSWIVRNNQIRHAHGWGIKVENGMVISDNVIVGGGQGGIGGVGDGMLIEHNLIEGNCIAGYRCFGWEGGGMKLSSSETTIRGNVVAANLGHGIHTDIDCVDVIIEDNLVTDNQGVGIDHEISGRAVIRTNTVLRNGFRPDGGTEAGIYVLSSSDVLVEGNVVEGNGDGIFLRQDRRTSEGLLERVTVRGNHIQMDGGAKTGFAFSARAFSASPAAAGIVFEDNTYVLDSADREDPPFQADDARLEIDGWQAAGYDVTGVFRLDAAAARRSDGASDDLEDLEQAE